MGINGFFRFLKDYNRNVNLSDFSGKTAAIDASCWIHKALAVSISQTGNRQRLADIFEKHLLVVKTAGVTPYVVFDGLPLSAKASEVEKRQRGREECLCKAESDGISSHEANKLRSQAISITFDDISTCVNICLKENVCYVVSAYESDAQIAFLLQNNHADLAITEDSDLITYGCNEVVVKLTLSGNGQCLNLDNILEGLNLNQKQFQSMCIVAGCDYLKNVRSVGIQSAYRIISSNDDLFKTLEKKGAPADYEGCFNAAMAIFSHQTVIDVNSYKTVPLNKWEATPSMELQLLCGKLLDDELSDELAAGNINPVTHLKVKSYVLLSKKVTINASDNLQGEASATCGHNRMEVHITSTERQSFPYTIPSFPVMAVDLIKVKFVLNGETCHGLINAKDHSALRPGRYVCTSYCDINIGGINYVVLWQLHVNHKQLPNPTPVTVHQLQNVSGTDEETHCLPFKVVGTCYSKSRQKALEAAYDCMHEYNRPVFAKLVSEPDNPADKNAIAVYVMTDNDYEKVGYIPRELTMYLHGPLNASELDVSVKDTSFAQHIY